MPLKVRSPVGAICAAACIVGRRQTLQVVGRLQSGTLARWRVRGFVDYVVVDSPSLLLSPYSVLRSFADR